MASKIEQQSTEKADDRSENLATVVLTWFIQVIGVAAAIVFGLFSVLAWTNSQTAKAQAETASVLAFAAICGVRDRSFWDRRASLADWHI